MQRMLSFQIYPKYLTDKLFTIFQLNNESYAKEKREFNENLHKKPHILPAIRSLLGQIFSEHIPREEFSYWVFGDLDVIFGDIDSFTLPIITKSLLWLVKRICYIREDNSQL